MINIKEYIDIKIQKNNLPIDLDETLAVVNKLQESGVYKNFTIYQTFYQYLLNIAGSIIAKVDINISESFGYLKPKQSYKRKNVIYYEFFTEEDYYNWLSDRKLVYSKTTNYDDIRILNFVEMCTINFNTDITTKCNYEVFDTLLNSVENFNKNGGIVENKKIPFITFIVEQFYKEKVYKPV